MTILSDSREDMERQAKKLQEFYRSPSKTASEEKKEREREGIR
jgi:hypothetical protein